ncbi:MAG: DUF1109 family protein [Proteobacteria bacterium]|nr:DUF1109 family protein [Pseudomonadota bacterium]
MKTDQLLEALVADRDARPRSLTGRLRGAMAVGIALSFALFLCLLGFRHDIGAALTTWRFELKIAIVGLALVVAFRLCRALLRPVPPAHPALYLLPLALLLAAAVALELALVPMSAWETRMIGTNSMVCLTAVPVLSLAPLAALFAMVRTAAPASPRRAGAALGLLAASAGAALYAFHCFDDSPLFVLVWYCLATFPVILLGAFAGGRLLRW